MIDWNAWRTRAADVWAGLKLWLAVALRAAVQVAIAYATTNPKPSLLTGEFWASVLTIVITQAAAAHLLDASLAAGIGSAVPGVVAHVAALVVTAGTIYRLIASRHALKMQAMQGPGAPPAPPAPGGPV